MKRTTALICLLLAALVAVAQGVPLMHNYTGRDYGAHNRNFAVVCGDAGVVYVANFEGLLYYDKSRWQTIHTQGIHRLTALYRDKNGRIWVGGYNYTGFIAYDAQGRLTLKSVTADGSVPFRGQVDVIWEDSDGFVCFQISDHSVFCVQHDKLVPVGALAPEVQTMPGTAEYEVNQVLTLADGLQAVATMGQGVLVFNAQGELLHHITEEYGLCNNNVNHIAYDGHGHLWGATDNGVFCISLPSIYSSFSANEGLRGEVLDIETLNGQLYVGTLNGLFYCTGSTFQPVAAIKHACWQLCPDGGTLLAATTGGIYRITDDGQARQLTTASSTAVLPAHDGFYSGELDGLFLYKGTFRSEVSDAEKVTMLHKDDDGNIWAQNLYGHIWLQTAGSQQFSQLQIDGQKDEVNTLVFGRRDIWCVNINGVWRWNGKKMVAADSKTRQLLAYPSISYTDYDGNIWLTDAEGHNLHVIKNNQLRAKYEKFILPLKDYVVRAIDRKKSHLWVGGNFGLIGLRDKQSDPVLTTKPQLLLRSVIMHGDSIVWGGFGKQPEQLPTLESNDVQIYYSLDYGLQLGSTLYRYRLNGGDWTVWSNRTFTHFMNMAAGSYTMEIQGRDPMGRLSNTVTLQFDIRVPLLLRWYMFLLYFLLAGLIIYLLVRWRIHLLEQDKKKLESIVRERTAEVAHQKDELMRQEKMATVGKLTQGLIDRILNPMNYISNFSKLSSGLIKDVRANIEDEQQHMDPENYEDTMDVLDMLSQNLSKVEQHGLSTTRTLKAMEEMLKDRSGGLVIMDLIYMLRDDIKMLHQYYQTEITEHHINIVFDCQLECLEINGNGEQLSKTIMNLLGNAVYAVAKKHTRIGQDYQPEVRLSVSVPASGKSVTITVHDNGIGIEQTIVNKIFDPFFTTKTTSEASGIGLYLSHEIVQNHGGTITVTSEKGHHTDFVITLPLPQPQK